MSCPFRIGDWVEVRPIREVLETLDENGSLEGLPFMPEMVKYCGRRYRIVKSAHKTCDPTGRTNMRKMSNAVYLDTRCDGACHDGCQARCLLFWKTAWLKPVRGPEEALIASPAEQAAIRHLETTTRYLTPEGVRYRCQGTEIVRATKVLATYDLKQYVDDITSGNVAVSFLLWHFFATRTRDVCCRLTRSFRKPPPAVCMPPPQRSALFELKPGDFVKVRSAKEIMPTLQTRRGPAFESEMLRHCGHTHRILYRVNRIIDEQSGKMLKLARDCVVLDGITCGGLDNCSRLFCPRSCYYFWREAWLEPSRSDTATSLPDADAASLRLTSQRVPREPRYRLGPFVSMALRLAVAPRKRRAPRLG